MSRRRVVSVTALATPGGGRLRSSAVTDAGEDSEAPIRIGRRLVWALVPLALLIAAVHLSGVLQHLDVEGIRATLKSAGIWAIPAFVVVYGLGIFAHVPGSIFVGAAVLAYGPWLGGAASYGGAFLGNVLTFGWVRLTGYRPLETVQWPVLQRLMARVDSHPTWTVLLVRIVFPTTAAVNYVLALSGLPTRAFCLGSLIGVLPQLVATVALFAAVF